MLNRKIVATTTSIFAAGSLIFFVLGNWLFGVWGNTISAISDFYFGVSADTLPGLLALAVIVAVDWYIGGWIFAWLYNLVEKKLK